MRATLFEGTDKLPFFFRWIDGRMVVTRDLTVAHALPVGTAISAVDGMPTATLLARLLPYVRGDGANDAKRIDLLDVRGDALYTATDVYLPLVIGRPSQTYALTVERPNGAAANVVVPAQTFADRRAAVGVSPAHDDRPLFTSRVLADGTVDLVMPTWNDYATTWPWRARLAQVLDDAARGRAPALLIDLRGNEGGDGAIGAAILAHLPQRAASEPDDVELVRAPRVPDDLRPYVTTYDPSLLDWGARAVSLATPLASAPHVPFLRRVASAADVSAEPTPAASPFRGPVFVAIDASNSSATFGFVRAVRARGLATLVGAPTGGNLRGIDGGAFLFLTLPQSGIEVDLPLVGYFPTSEQPDAGIAPDIAVPLTRDAIVRGDDPVIARIEAISRALRRRRPPSRRGRSAPRAMYTVRT